MSVGGPGLTALPLSTDVFGTPRRWAPAAEGASRPWDKGRDGFVLRPPHGRRLLPRRKDPSIGIYRPCQRVIARAGLLRSCHPTVYFYWGEIITFLIRIFFGWCPSDSSAQSPRMRSSSWPSGWPCSDGRGRWGAGFRGVGARTGPRGPHPRRVPRGCHDHRRLPHARALP